MVLDFAVPPQQEEEGLQPPCGDDTLALDGAGRRLRGNRRRRARLGLRRAARQNSEHLFERL